MTEYQLAAMSRAGEHGEPIFRAPSVGCSGVKTEPRPNTGRTLVEMAEKCGGRVVGHYPLSGPCVAMSEGDLERFVYACGRAIALNRAATGETS